MTTESTNVSGRHVLNGEERKKVEFLFQYFEKEVGTKLASHDLDFLISVEKQFKKDGKLSDKQIGVMEKIFKKY